MTDKRPNGEELKPLGEDEDFLALQERFRAKGERYANLTDEQRAQLKELREAEENAARETMLRAEIKQRLTLIPPRHYHVTLEMVPLEEVRSWTYDFAAGKTDQGILLQGPVGGGKTGTMWAIYRYLTERGIFNLEVHKVLTLLRRLRPGGDGDDLYRRLVMSPLLMLDDLGVQKDSPWTDERIFEIIDERYDELRPTFVTGNIPITEMENKRVASRLQGMCYVIDLIRKDRRLEE